jgi:glycosyltransferase involved in cell wall biosynthesis
VHSCADAAHVAAMCNILGGPSYSLTLHGDLPVYGVDHAAKMARAACISCDGPHLKEQIVREVGYPAEKILPNWMGLDTHQFSPSQRSEGQVGRLQLATVARLDACKGHRFAIAAVRKAVDEGCDVRYTLAGEGPERANIERLIQQLRLSDRVQLLGTRGESEVLELLRRSDAFVLSSVGMGEAGPISLMEAMSCGLPAVCSIIGATPQMLTDGVEGMLIPQEDEAKLAAGFVRLAREPALRQSLGAAARRRAVSQFDSAATTRRLLEFIELHTGLSLREGAGSSTVKA